MSKSKPISFFEKYAVEYDLMTNAASREPRHREEVKALIEIFKPKSVLDAGCGTGLTSKMFAEQGISVVGIDASPEMVRMASERCAEFGSLSRFEVARFESLGKSFTGKFDLAVCLANSLSGVDSTPALTRSLRQFRKSLAMGGTLVIQMLNPAVLIDGVPVPVKASRHEQVLYHRFAVRLGDRINLNIVRTDLSQTSGSFEAFVHSYQPLSVQKLSALLKAVGFRSVKTYGNLLLTAPFNKESKDLIVVARRIS